MLLFTLWECKHVLEHDCKKALAHACKPAKVTYTGKLHMPLHTQHQTLRLYPKTFGEGPYLDKAFYTDFFKQSEQIVRK